MKIFSMLVATLIVTGLLTIAYGTDAKPDISPKITGLKYVRIDKETILITDGFFYKKNNSKLDYETTIHIKDVNNGIFQTEGVVPAGFDTAIGVTWIFDKPSISFHAGENDYKYTSKYKGAMIKFTEKGVLVKGFKIDVK